MIAAKNRQSDMVGFLWNPYFTDWVKATMKDFVITEFATTLVKVPEHLPLTALTMRRSLLNTNSLISLPLQLMPHVIYTETH